MLVWQAHAANGWDGPGTHSGHASGVKAMTTAAAIRQKTPSTVSPHCMAVKSFAPSSERAGARLPATTRVRRLGHVAISQASLLAQTLYKLVIDGLRNAAVQHGDSLGDRKARTAGLGGKRQAPGGAHQANDAERAPLRGWRAGVWQRWRRGVIRQECEARLAVCRWRHCIARVHTRPARLPDGPRQSHRPGSGSRIRNVYVIFYSAVYLNSSLGRALLFVN